MLKETLSRLNQARLDKQPVVLVSQLSTGAQSLYSKTEKLAGNDLSRDQLSMAMQALDMDQCRKYLDGEQDIFIQPFNTPLRMIIIGAVHITQSLVSLASHCDYQVIVIDPREAFASPSRFPGIDIMTDWPDQALEQLQPDPRTAVVSLSHDPKIDDPALAVALRSEAFYIGALGSRKTQQARHDRLLGGGCTEQQLARIHGPIGLDIGARSPAEIAISIMAEVTRSLHQKVLT